MTHKEKSLELAKLMGWYVHVYDTHVNFESAIFEGVLQPYEKNEYGLAQFAAILLKFPEVIFRQADITSIDTGKDIGFDSRWHYYDFNQTEILDEILRMNGVEL